jgi:hypothetical protein
VSRSARRGISIGLIAAGLSMLGCDPLSGYRGDGTLSAVEFPWNPGLKLEFEEFSLASAYAASYRLDGLPRTEHPNRYLFGLALELTPEESDAWPLRPRAMLANGQISLVLTDGEGRSLMHSRGQLNALVWTRRKGDDPFGRPVPAGDPLGSALRYVDLGSGPAAPSRLEVRYVPGSFAPDRKVRVRVFAGAVYKYEER